jgi:hypothetical protein
MRKGALVLALPVRVPAPTRFWTTNEYVGEQLPTCTLPKLRESGPTISLMGGGGAATGDGAGVVGGATTLKEKRFELAPPGFVTCAVQVAGMVVTFARIRT